MTFINIERCNVTTRGCLGSSGIGSSRPLILMMMMNVNSLLFIIIGTVQHNNDKSAVYDGQYSTGSCWLALVPVGWMDSRGSIGSFLSLYSFWSHWGDGVQVPKLTSIIHGFLCTIIYNVAQYLVIKYNSLLLGCFWSQFSLFSWYSKQWVLVLRVHYCWCFHKYLSTNIGWPSDQYVLHGHQSMAERYFF